MSAFKNDERLEIFLSKLKEIFDGHIKSISLFGSRARQDNEKHSDYDILVVFDEITKEDREKLHDLAGDMLYEYNTVFSIFPVTNEDLQRKRFSPFIINMQKEAVAL